MAYFGKEFAVEKEENYDAFIKSLDLPAEAAAKFSSYKPKTKLEKDGDTYKFTSSTPESSTVVEFKSGVEFDEQLRPNISVKSKYTVDGDTITQQMSKDDKTITFKREFTADKLKVTITANFWDGVAYRYYSALK